RACPLPGKALKIGVFETPHIQPEHCVGCGLCEHACLTDIPAIRVRPLGSLDPASAGAPSNSKSP
ncbi:MAG TPA: hypothetical protein EYP14_01835, partial [Planctomycetaceae bacterium]|nr:hypothetical protein [Planctomycetaceae bacterium]